MAESEELETLVYCLGPVGGRQNNVLTQGLGFSSKYDYTKTGYSRYIEEANHSIKFQNLIIDYFIQSVKSEFEEDPLAFVDAESEEDLMASIHKMKKHWREMFREHQKELREVLKNPNKAQGIKELSEEGSSSSSAKIRRLDPLVSSEASSSRTPKSESEATSESSEKTLKSDEEATHESGSVGVPVDEVKFPISIFHRKLKEFHQALKMEYRDLRARMGKALERFSRKDTTVLEEARMGKALDRFSSKNTAVQDLKGFTYLKMGTFAKWKYSLKTLGHLVLELEKKFSELDLDFYEKKKNEKRLTDWMFFDDGRRDRIYHHRLLITMDLVGPIEEVSGIVYKQLRRWGHLTQSLADKLPEEYGAFKEKVKEFQVLVLCRRPIKKIIEPQKSTDSGDSLFNIDDMPEET